MNRWDLGRGRGGSVLQSGIAKGDPRRSPLRANGLTLQGVVTAVYVYDSAEGPNTTDIGAQPNTVYCDVLCYGKNEGSLPRVLVTYGRSGLHEGEISLPRPAKIAINEQLDPARTNPANMDGDHVIVGFLDDDLKQPYLQRYLPHPASDVGNGNKAIGHRMRLKGADGDPRFWKHKGSFWGIDKDGNWVFDLTEAHKGVYQADGTEPAPAGNGDSGNFTVKLPASSTLHVQIDGGESILIEDKDGNAQVTVGDGAMHVPIVEHLRSKYNELINYIQNAQVLTAMGPSGTISAQSGPAPAWDSAIESTKVSIPDG